MSDWELSYSVLYILKMSQNFKIQESLVNICLGLLFTYLARPFWLSYSVNKNVSSFLFLLYAVLAAFFFLVRKHPISFTKNPADWALGVSATCIIPFLFHPLGGTKYILGWCLQSLGVLLQVFSIASLNRSLGIVPANRGVKTNGMYRIVRHPMYMSYLLSISGLVINNMSLYNACVFFIWLAAQLARIRQEELFLSATSKSYRMYIKKTKWCLIPYLY